MYLIVILINLYITVIIVQVALSWLIAFDIINGDNEAARNLTQLTHKLTDPVFNKIRKYVPPIANIDITPLIVIIGLQILISILPY